ncbi:unnamed protein product [Alternaria alternata]
MRPRKKRGPKNRYVHSLRARLDGNGTFVAESEPQQPRLGLIAPPAIIHQITTDWFDWIHPVAPLFHRTLFMQRISEDHGSTAFFLLVVSVCAATVASLRRRRHLYGELSVEACLDLAERFRMWSVSSEITLERTLALYNFSSAVNHEHGLGSPLTYRLFAGSSVGIKYLIHENFERMSFMDQQTLKRLYWLIYAGQCTCDMHGRQLLVLRHAHEAFGHLIPLEISDIQLLHGADASSAEDTGPGFSYVPGLNVLSRLFMVWHSSQAITTQTMDNLHEHIMRAQQLLEDVPPELAWRPPHAVGQFAFNVQKVNLKVTQLHIRSNLLEQMNTLAKDQNMRVTPGAIIDERHRVVDELLDVLYNMPEEVFDANGYSIVPKIRDIGGALLDELRTGSQGTTLQASINLDKLLAKLESLDQRVAVQTPYV